MFGSVEASPDDVARALPGDDLVRRADVVMDRSFDLPAPPELVWPWFVQLGKKRAGWYLPRSVERLVPARRRALRWIDPALQDLRVGSVIPDWGGKNETFEVAVIEPPRALVHTTQRGRTSGSWAIVLTAYDGPAGPATHVQLRLRLAPVKRRRLAGTLGELVDAATVAGLAAGLRERLAEAPRPGWAPVSERPSYDETHELTVDGERFSVGRRSGEACTYDYTWLTGPNDGYGFTTSMSLEHTMTDAEHEESIRGFLSGIDPATGYLAD
ncbi:MAG TPA: hypothetical protein VFJ89_02145 [Nocardioides sp.]|nr:hypothetical protein [Nocardioides sp.]